MDGFLLLETFSCLCGPAQLLGRHVLSQTSPGSGESAELGHLQAGVGPNASSLCGNRI